MHIPKRVGVGIRVSIVVLSVFAVGFLVGTQVTMEGNNPFITDEIGTHDTENRPDLALFWEVWEELDENFAGASPEDIPTDEERVFGAISGLTRSFGDPYTAFLPPVESELFEEDITGNFGGVGMEIGIRDELLTVIAPLPNTPAEKSGILAGDVVVSIDNTTTFGIGVDEAVLRIRGEVGTSVVLTIRREGVENLFDVEVVRDVITIPTLSTHLRDDNVFVIELFNFGLSSSDDFRNALREFILSGSHDLVLDLRGNPGGFLSASIDITSWFLPTGKVVVLEETEETSHVHRSRGYDVFGKALDMVVLIDGGSASASEIVAGALQDHGIATLVGTQTFGKGSVQELVDIGEESSLRLTVAHWLTPNGNSISENGLTPDFIVEITLEDLEQGRDPQIEKAVDLLLNEL